MNDYLGKKLVKILKSKKYVFTEEELFIATSVHTQDDKNRLLTNLLTYEYIFLTSNDNDMKIYELTDFGESTAIDYKHKFIKTDVIWISTIFNVLLLFINLILILNK